MKIWLTILSLIFATGFLRLFYYVRYTILKRKINYSSALKDVKFNFSLNQIDNIFSFFPFFWLWLDITIFVLLVSVWHYPYSFLLLSFFVAGRYRALQELTHIGMHQGICRSKNIAFWQANVFFQYPLFKPDIYFRRKSHYRHHFTNYDENDPNVQDFFRVGLVPGISLKKFIYCLLYPLTPFGILDTFNSAYKNFFKNKSPWRILFRLFIVLIIACYFYFLAGVQGVFWGYFIAGFLIYPFLSWIAQVAEHRWFVPQTSTKNRYEYEFVNGRASDYPGFIGYLIREYFFPFGDSYHLAHSLYISAHWILLKDIDVIMKKTECKYTAFRSEGLFFPKCNIPSAISELKNRLVTK